MSDVTVHAPRCADCSILTAEPTRPRELLDRLPEALFSRAAPVDPEGATFDEIFFDETVFGPVGGTEPTPQWELARNFVRERNQVVLALRQAVADQHGLGLMRVTDDGVAGQCPRASGAALDRVGEQFGIGRPTGFTDCCYWRLILLLLFKPGSTRWLLSELAELYTGTRPGVTETPARLTLTWPTAAAQSFYGARTDDPENPGGWFHNVDAFYAGDAPPPAPAAVQGFWLAGGDAGQPRSFFGPTTVRIARGLDLAGALDLVKAAGVAVALANLPKQGRTGCYGAALRGGELGGAVWA